MNTAWRIGITGKNPYGTDTPDGNHVARSSMHGSIISKCRQCIYTELCRSFSSIDNVCSSGATKPANISLRVGAYIAYDCKRFTVDALNDEPSNSVKRFVQINWITNEGAWAGPSIDFTH